MGGRLSIRCEPLTREAFSAFGDLLETDGIRPESINFGNTVKYADLVSMSAAENALGQISIYQSKSIDLPFRVRLMERHPLAAQAFFPLHQRPFPIVVAKAGAPPDAGDIRVFMSNGRQGIKLHRGTWHHYQLSLVQESQYLVIDAGGAADNYQEHWLDEEVYIVS